MIRPAVKIDPHSDTVTPAASVSPAVDALTEVATRQEFLRGLGSLLEPRSATTAEYGIDLLLVHVHGLAGVNATLGLAAGDAVLACMVERLQHAAGTADLVGRVGGTTFGVVLAAGETGEDPSPTDRLIDDVGAPLTVAFDGRDATLTVDVASTHAGPGAGVDRTMGQAEIALARATSRHRGGHEAFSTALHEGGWSRRRLQLELSQATERRELLVRYQPIVDIRQDATIGVETLVRWRHPYLGLLSPRRFIEIAEESQAIDVIGAWVLDAACMQAAAWKAQGVDLEVGVNISPFQLENLDLVGKVTDALTRHRLAPRQLNLEVTESALLDNTDQAIEVLETLHSRGVRISLDDFGTGYSALNLLRDLPIDVIKLDRTFVAGIVENPKEWALARAIVQVARSLDMRLLAEGVETTAQLAHLRALDADLAQGYLFSRPVDADRLDLHPVATARGRHATT